MRFLMSEVPRYLAHKKTHVFAGQQQGGDGLVGTQPLVGGWMGCSKQGGDWLVDRWASSTLDPEPLPVNPKPYTLNPEISTFKSKP